MGCKQSHPIDRPREYRKLGARFLSAIRRNNRVIPLVSTGCYSKKIMWTQSFPFVNLCNLCLILLQDSDTLFFLLFFFWRHLHYGVGVPSAYQPDLRVEKPHKKNRPGKKKTGRKKSHRGRFGPPPPGSATGHVPAFIIRKDTFYKPLLNLRWLRCLVFIAPAGS